jgi:ACR3 family arsenite efflux pump ArsB
MMWPILTKVQYERLPKIFSTARIWYQIGISLILNWVIGPFVRSFIPLLLYCRSERATDEWVPVAFT